MWTEFGSTDRKNVEFPLTSAANTVDHSDS